MADITLGGNPCRTCGELPAVGAAAPEFELTTTDLGSATLSGYRGRKVVLNIFPSVDTEVCAASVRRFNAEAAGRDDAAVLCISNDLPFAQARFCGGEGLDDVVALSAFRDPSFGEEYGVRIEDGAFAGLLARAVVVVDEEGKVIHDELVGEIGDEPDYEAALAVL